MRRPERPSAPLLLTAGLLLVNQAPAPAAGAAREPFRPGLPAAALPAPPNYSTATNCIPAWVVDAGGVRRLPDRCFQPTARTVGGAAAAALAAQPAATPPPPAPMPVPPRATAARKASKDCRQPYWTDAKGVRRLKPGCL